MRLGLVLLLCSACNNGTTPAPPATSGAEEEDADDALDIAGITLPALPHGISVSRAPLGEGVRLARETGDLERPALLESATSAEVQAYMAGPLREWMLERGRGLREVRAALREAEDGEEGELVVAAAVIGVLYLRFALDLAELPLPDAVRADPGARLGIRNALLEAASRSSTGRSALSGRARRTR